MQRINVYSGAITLALLIYWIFIYPALLPDGWTMYLVGASALWLMILFIAAKPANDGSGQSIGLAYLVLLGLIVWVITAVRGCVSV